MGTADCKKAEDGAPLRNRHDGKPATVEQTAVSKPRGRSQPKVVVLRSCKPHVKMMFFTLEPSFRR